MHFMRITNLTISTILATLFSISLSGSVLAIEETSFPQTVSESVSRLLSNMDESELRKIAATRKGDLILFHSGLGMGIRNSFGLWRGNQALLNDCGNADGHPDSCSTIIIEALWVETRKKLPSEYVAQLDETHALIDKIDIAPYEVRSGGMLSYVAFLNKQIAESEFNGKLSLAAACSSHHYRLKDFSRIQASKLRLALGYIQLFLTEVIVEPGKVYLEPAPFLNSPPCDA